MNNTATLNKQYNWQSEQDTYQINKIYSSNLFYFDTFIQRCDKSSNYVKTKKIRLLFLAKIQQKLIRSCLRI